jgi:hypothetical protein
MKKKDESTLHSKFLMAVYAIPLNNTFFSNIEFFSRYHFQFVSLLVVPCCAFHIVELFSIVFRTLDLLARSIIQENYR